MDSMIHIGAKIDKDTSSNLADFIDKVFESGRKHQMDQSTIIHALNLGSKMAESSHHTLSGCNLIGEKHVHIATEEMGEEEA